jgi:hypothetical protein
MTHTHDDDSKPAAPELLPEFPSTATPEERTAVWTALVRDGDRVPDEQLDRALVKLLEEIRLSL